MKSTYLTPHVRARLREMFGVPSCYYSEIGKLFSNNYLLREENGTETRTIVFQGEKIVGVFNYGKLATVIHPWDVVRRPNRKLTKGVKDYIKSNTMKSCVKFLVTGGYCICDSQAKRVWREYNSDRKKEVES